jgi:hypothetical protein
VSLKESLVYDVKSESPLLGLKVKRRINGGLYRNNWRNLKYVLTSRYILTGKCIRIYEKFGNIPIPLAADP